APVEPALKPAAPFAPLDWLVDVPPPPPQADSTSAKAAVPATKAPVFNFIASPPCSNRRRLVGQAPSEGSGQGRALLGCARGRFRPPPARRRSRAALAATTRSAPYVPARPTSSRAP